MQRLREQSQKKGTRFLERKFLDFAPQYYAFAQGHCKRIFDQTLNNTIEQPLYSSDMAPTVLSVS
jgi:hypothetical protein